MYPGPDYVVAYTIVTRLVETQPRQANEDSAPGRKQTSSSFLARDRLEVLADLFRKAAFTSQETFFQLVTTLSLLLSWPSVA